MIYYKIHNYINFKTLKKNKMDIIKKIKSATKASDIVKALTELGITVPTNLQSASQSDKQKKSFRTAIAILAGLLVMGGTVFAFKGAKSVFGSDLPAYGVIFFALLDLALIYVIWAELTKGFLKGFIICCEVLTLLFFGYVMNGTFGNGSLKSVANQKVTEMYASVKQTVAKDADALYEARTTAKQKAVSIKLLEESRDGKGVVYEKASMIADEAIEEPSELPKAPTAPDFENLPEANQWLQSQKSILDGYAGKLASYCSSSKASAKGAAGGIMQASDGKLSDMQRSNLQVLGSILDDIANTPLHTEPIAAPILSQADMKGVGVGSFLGYLVEGVVALLLIILGIISSNGADAELYRRDAIIAATQNFSSKNRMPFMKGGEKLDEIDLDALVSVMELAESDQNFRDYAKRCTVAQLARLAYANPVLLGNLPNAKWSIEDIINLSNDTSTDFVGKAILIDKAKWDIVLAKVSNKEKALSLASNPDMLEKFLEITETLERKLANKDAGEVKRTIGQLLPDNSSQRYLEVLQYFAERLPAKVIEILNKNFIQMITKPIAELMVKHINTSTPDLFQKIINAWTGEDTETLTEMIEDQVSKEPAFGQLVGTLLNARSTDGLRMLKESFLEASAAKSSSAFSMKIGISVEKLTQITEAIRAQDMNKLSELCRTVFETKQSV